VDAMWPRGPGGPTAASDGLLQIGIVCRLLSSSNAGRPSGPDHRYPIARGRGGVPAAPPHRRPSPVLHCSRASSVAGVTAASYPLNRHQCHGPPPPLGDTAAPPPPHRAAHSTTALHHHRPPPSPNDAAAPLTPRHASPTVASHRPLLCCRRCTVGPDQPLWQVGPHEEGCGRHMERPVAPYSFGFLLEHMLSQLVLVLVVD
jgi:hypothetical protein